jgi:hypothetical protein
MTDERPDGGFVGPNTIRSIKVEDESRALAFFYYAFVFSRRESSSKKKKTGHDIIIHCIA